MLNSVKPYSWSQFGVQQLMSKTLALYEIRKFYVLNQH